MQSENIPISFINVHGFVYLSSVDSSIVQDIRYGSLENFVGRPIPGYEHRQAICTVETANALRAVNEELAVAGYRLVVYDAYRPQKASDYFVQWAEDLHDQAKGDIYYPFVNKSTLFDLGYIAERSCHSRGSTVDVTLMRLDGVLLKSPVAHTRVFEYKSLVYLDDGTVDMGTSFDLFDELSWHDNTQIDQHHLYMRNFLRDTMERWGFVAYEKEWWHYTLKNEPFPDAYFDF